MSAFEDPATRIPGGATRPAAYQNDPSGARPSPRLKNDSLAPARNEQLQSIQYRGDLEKFVRHLARQLRINVVFDRDFPRREVSVDLIDVTAAQALSRRLTARASRTR